MIIKTIKLYLYAALAIAIAVAAAIIFFSPTKGGLFDSKLGDSVSIHAIARQYLETAQMISSQCKYNDVFELSEEKLKNIYGMSIPGTERHAIIKASGTVFLGIDCKNIAVDTTRADTLFITFPPIEIIAHEFEFTAIHDLSGIFRKYNIKTIPDLRSNYKRNVESSTIKDKTAISMAQTSMEKAFRNIPTLKEVPIAFMWETPAKRPTVDFKRETPIDLKWELGGE
ncbi:MAG: DUF4230 domain-containing protein [Chitinispirillales bacterium]|nr:DUF4230 domain-containing protein [Chitinispirillales bacterium]